MTGSDLNQLVRGGAKESESLRFVALQTNTTAIAVFAGLSDNRPQLKSLQLSDPAQRVGDALFLGFELGVVAEMLPRTAAA